MQVGQEFFPGLKKDVKESSLTKESLIKSAWSSRDAAVERKNVAEVDLERTGIESTQVIRETLYRYRCSTHNQSLR